MNLVVTVAKNHFLVRRVTFLRYTIHARVRMIYISWTDQA